jgi:hypothetical protein
MSGFRSQPIPQSLREHDATLRRASQGSCNQVPGPADEKRSSTGSEEVQNPDWTFHLQ